MLSELIVKHYDKLNKNDLYLCQFISTHKKECSSLTIEELAAIYPGAVFYALHRSFP